VVADAKRTFVLSGAGDVIEPDFGAAAVGSGGRTRSPPPAHCWITHARRPADRRGRAGIAADTCIYTNRNLSFEEL
jgi:ATP-dependent HslUV protease subunit HslV